VNDFHIQCLTDRRTDGKTFNLGSGQNHSVREIFAAIEKVLGTGISPLYKGDLPGEAQITLADIAAARAVGWTPKVSLDEGLLRSIEYIRRHVLPAA